MQPLVSSSYAWCCTVLSAFGIVCLTFIGYLFASNHESMMGSINDPEDGKAVSHTVYLAALVYLGFFLFCGSQIMLHKRAARSRIQL